jgi:hypothetical protein
VLNQPPPDLLAEGHAAPLARQERAVSVLEDQPMLVLSGLGRGLSVAPTGLLLEVCPRVLGAALREIVTFAPSATRPSQRSTVSFRMQRSSG